jgi:hypothetical protein
MKELPVKLTVMGTSLHCSNDCNGMSNDAQRCHYFNQKLAWDPKRKYNGNKRLGAYLEAEIDKNNDK